MLSLLPEITGSWRIVLIIALALLMHVLVLTHVSGFTRRALAVIASGAKQSRGNDIATA